MLTSRAMLLPWMKLGTFLRPINKTAINGMEELQDLKKFCVHKRNEKVIASVLE